jgi:predicted kinase
MLIVLSGLPATGKSELGLRIARALSITAVPVDPIESAMVESGIERSFLTGLAAYRIGEAIADSQLAIGQAVLVDAANLDEPAKDIWRALAARRGVPLRVIECHCSDSATHRRRLAARRRRMPDSLLEKSWTQVVEQSDDYTAWSEPMLRLDAVDAGEDNAARAIVWLLGPEPQG